MISNKKFKVLFMIFSLLCIVAIGVCMICDFAVSKKLTWSLFIICSVPFAWLIITPLLVAKKNKVILSLGIFTLILIPFIYILERLVPASGWFTPLGMPIGITGIVVAWLTYILIKFVKINIWYLLAVIIFLYAVLAGMVVRYFTSSYLGISFFNIDNIINTFSGIVIVILLGIIGYGNKKGVKNNE